MEKSKILVNQPPHLPPQALNKQGLKTLVLDLDETLVHSSMHQLEGKFKSIEVNYKNTTQTIYVSERPFLNLFLKSMAEYYEIYAEKVINCIDPQNQFISFCLYRQHCIFDNDVYLKDLRQLGRNMSEIIIVDNSNEAYQLTPENGFLIASYFDDSRDRELYDLIPFFLQLSELDDVREVEIWKEKYDKIMLEEMNQNSIPEFGKNELPQIEEEMYPTMASTGCMGQIYIYNMNQQRWGKIQ